MKPDRIISGGQTGADRAALDVAISYGLDYGGWIPLGRWAEDGPIPQSYSKLRTCDSSDPAVRTRLNVQDSDATLILSHGALSGGSALTRDITRELAKPCLHLDLDRVSQSKAVAEILNWLETNKVVILNVAGPRHSEDPGIYDQAQALLFKLFDRP